MASSKPDWPQAGLKRFEASLPDFLNQQGASEGIMQMLALGHDLGGIEQDERSTRAVYFCKRVKQKL